MNIPHEAGLVDDKQIVGMTWREAPRDWRNQAGRNTFETHGYWTGWTGCRDRIFDPRKRSGRRQREILTGGHTGKREAGAERHRQRAFMARSCLHSILPD